MSRLDPRQHVRPQQELRIAAAQVNAINKLMGVNTSLGSGPLQFLNPAPTVVLCKNNYSADCDLGSPLAITGVLVDPSDGGRAVATFREGSPVIGDQGGESHETTNRFGIAVEPIKAGKIGRLAVSGVVGCQIRIEKDSHWRAVYDHASRDLKTSGSDGVPLLWKSPGTGSGKWAIVHLAGGGGGGIRLCKSGSSTWNKGSARTVDVWEDGECGSESQSTGVTIDARNLYADVPANKFCSVAKHGNGCWYVIAAECS